MVVFTRGFRTSGQRDAGADSARGARVGYVEGALPGPGSLETLKGLFPNSRFERLDRPFTPGKPFDVLLTRVDAGNDSEVDAALEYLGKQPSGAAVVICLDRADIATTRILVHAGAADVLPQPVSEPALALCLERLLARTADVREKRGEEGEIVAVLKAGGGVGATSLIVQMATLMSAGADAGVCIADLDLQFGSAATYLDLPDAVTVGDSLTWGAGLADAPYQTALSKHPSGIRLLAAPRDIMGLESLSASQADAMATGLKKNFTTTFVDLPSAWTNWTYQLLQKADKIMLVTHLSVAHAQLVKRQMALLSAQRLGDKPLFLVCNAVSADHAASVSVKTAERSIGRPFDAVIPHDHRTMLAALNQGVSISAIRRGTPLEKALGGLSIRLGAPAPAAEPDRAWRFK